MGISLDKDKAEMFFLYSLAAAQRLQHKEDAHKRLSDQLGKLKDLRLDDSVKAHLEVLERRINDLVKTEKGIARIQGIERSASDDIGERLTALDERLARYSKARSSRKAKIVVPKRSTRKPIDKYAAIRAHLAILEKEYSKLSKDKSVSKLRMRNLASRINTLKRKVKK